MKVESREYSLLGYKKRFYQNFMYRGPALQKMLVSRHTLKVHLDQKPPDALASRCTTRAWCQIGMF